MGKLRKVGLAIVTISVFVIASCGTSDQVGNPDAPTPDPSQNSSGQPDDEGASVEADNEAGPRALLPADLRESGVIKVAADMHYPPADYYEDDGKVPAGADYEVGQAIGDVLGVKMEVSDVTFDNVIPGLKSGQYDMAVTFMTDTVERQEVVDFVDAYQSGSSILVLKGNPEGIQEITDLCGKTITTTKTSVQIPLAEAQDEACAELGLDPIDILTVNTDTDALLAVKSGRATADLAETVTANYNAATANDGEDFEVVGPVYDPHLVGMVILKGNDGLRDAVAEALQALMEDGTYDKILAKYGLTQLALPEVLINGTTE